MEKRKRPLRYNISIRYEICRPKSTRLENLSSILGSSFVWKLVGKVKCLSVKIAVMIPIVAAHYGKMLIIVGKNVLVK